MSSIAVSKRLISSEEYHMMGEAGLLKPDERVELIHGEIINLSPIGNKHAVAVSYISTLLIEAFKRKVFIWSQNPIHIDQWNEPQPDIAVLRYNLQRYNATLPEPKDVEAIIEVACTSYDIDKNIKLPIYATSGIPAYWIVNLPENRIEVYSDPESEQYNNQRNYYSEDHIPLLDKEFDVSEILI